MKTSDHQRGYGKGYTTGLARGERQAAVAHAEAKNAAERAERAEKAQGMGHCEGCGHWERGGAHCAWGYCRADRQAGTPWGTWFKPESGDGRVMTAPRFGCVLFIQRVSVPVGDHQK